MKISLKSLVVALTLSLAALTAPAQTPAAPASGMPAAESEQRCAEGTKRCKTEANRMSQAMIDACAKTPAACKERHEKAAARRAAKAQANQAKD